MCLNTFVVIFRATFYIKLLYERDNFLRKGLGSLISFSSAFNFEVARKFITENIRWEERLVFEYKYTKFSD